MVRLERLWPKLAYVMKIGFASWFVLVSNRGGGHPNDHEVEKCSW